MGLIETKVIAATAGSGLGAAVSAFLLWALGVVAFGASSNADQAAKAVAAVPEPAGALLSIMVAVAGAFILGHAAPHTARPDLVTPTAPPPVVVPVPTVAAQVVADPATPPVSELPVEVVPTEPPAPVS